MVWFMNTIVSIVFLAVVYSIFVYFLLGNAKIALTAIRQCEDEKMMQESRLEDQIKGLQFSLSDAQEHTENLSCRNDVLDRELTKVLEYQCKFEALFRAKAAQVEALQMRNRNLNSEINGGPQIKRVTTMEDWKNMDPTHQLGEIIKRKNNEV